MNTAWKRHFSNANGKLKEQLSKVECASSSPKSSWKTQTLERTKAILTVVLAKSLESCYKWGIHFLKKSLWFRVILKAWTQSLNHDRQVLMISILCIYLSESMEQLWKASVPVSCPGDSWYPHPHSLLFRPGLQQCRQELSSWQLVHLLPSWVLWVVYTGSSILFKAATTHF